MPYRTFRSIKDRWAEMSQKKTFANPRWRWVCICAIYQTLWTTLTYNQTTNCQVFIGLLASLPQLYEAWHRQLWGHGSTAWTSTSHHMVVYSLQPSTTRWITSLSKVVNKSRSHTILLVWILSYKSCKEPLDPFVHLSQKDAILLWQLTHMQGSNILRTRGCSCLGNAFQDKTPSASCI